MCLTASCLAIFALKSFKSFQNVFKYSTVAAFHIYAQHGEDAMLSMVKMPLKGEVGGHALNSHGYYIVDHGKSWNCVFEFLLEPCYQGLS